MKTSPQPSLFVYISLILLSVICFLKVAPSTSTADSSRPATPATPLTKAHGSAIATELAASILLDSGTHIGTGLFDPRQNVQPMGNPTDVFWTNVAGGNWDVAANWVDGVGVNRVPTASDNVFVNLSGTYTVTLNVNATVNSVTVGGTAGIQTFTHATQTLTLNNASSVNANGVLNFTGGTITGPGPLTINSTLNWGPGGTLGGTTNIVSGATLNINRGGSNNQILNGVLNNSGTAILTGPVAANGVFVSGTFNNLVGGVFDIRTDLGLRFNSGNPVFNNAGIFRKSVTAGTSPVEVAFNNTGTVDLQTGTMIFSGGGTDTGPFNVSSGTTLEFSGGTHTLQASSSINAANGTVNLSNGTVNIACLFNAGTISPIGANANFTGNIITLGNALTVTGTANFNSNPIAVNTLTVSGTLNLNFTGSLTPATVNFTGGNIGGSTNLDIPAGATMNWGPGGTLGGTGVTNIAFSATLNINRSNANNQVLNRVLNNSGNAIMTGPVTANGLFVSGTFNNLAGGVFDIRTEIGLRFNSGSPVFNNAGTFRKSVTAGASPVEIEFNNTGTVDIQTGTLSFNGGGTHTGPFNAASGTTLGFGNGTHTLQASSSINAASGTVDLSGGVINIACPFNAGTMSPIAGQVTFTGNIINLGNNALTVTGTADFNSNPITLNTLTVSGTLNLNFAGSITPATVNFTAGTIGGSTNLDIPAGGTMNWGPGGTLGGTGVTNIASGATLNINRSTANNQFLNRVLNNSGTAIMTGPVAANGLFVSGTFNNLAGAIFDIRTELGVRFNSGNPVFNNAGTFRKSVTAGASLVEIEFNNTGTVDIQIGAVSFNSGGTHTGPFNVSSGATLGFGGAAHSLQASSGINAVNGTVSLSGGTVDIACPFNAGTISPIGATATFTGNIINLGGNALTVTGTANFNSNPIVVNTLTVSGTLNLNFSGSLTPATVDFTAGTIGGSSNLDIPPGGSMNWGPGGTFAGTGVTNIASGATLNINRSNANNQFLNRVLNNAGTAIMTGPVTTNSVFVSGTINNLAGGVFDIRTELGLRFNTGSPVFNNAGTFRKSVTPGASPVGIAFNNTGTVDIQTGSLSFSSTYIQTAGSTVLNGGGLNKAGAASLDIQGGELRGAGTITGNVNNTGGSIRPGLSAGCLTITGNYIQGAAGVLDLEIGGPAACSGFDQLTVTGTAALAGTLNTNLINGYVPAVGTPFQVLNYASHTGSFATIGGPFTPTYNATNLTLTSVAAGCPVTPIVFGQSINGNLNAGSCIVNGPTDLYTFVGNAGQQIVVTLDSIGSNGIQAASLELLNGGGTVASNSGTTNARIPANGFLQLLTTDVYTIRVTSPASFGDYALSLSLQPGIACNYSVAPSTTNVSPSGGTSFFDVLSGVGCPTVTAAVGANSAHIQIMSNTGGRVTFSVSAHSGTTDRVGTIIAGGQTHTITQFGVAPPANDLFAQAQVLPGASGSVSGRNTNATAEANEPPHGGSPASRSVWYRWTAPTSGLFSFTTSGSTFDTVMAIYTGTSVNALTRIAENDDTTGFDPTSKVNFRATTGVVYYIAVDGRNGDSGSIQLSYGPYRRLFRLYLQNFNGFASPISPTSVTAIRQDGTGPTIPGEFVSLGVYEFDLPDDNSPYIVTIAGPDGITWVPSTYVIDNTSGRFDELMNGAPGGGQNQTSNPTNTIPRRFKGFIHGISTQPSLTALRVQITSMGTTSAIPPRDCPNPMLVGGGPGGAMRALYDCIAQPNSTHQIVPNAPQTAFQVPVLSLPVINIDTGPASANAITATNSPTYNISGTVQSGAQGLGDVNVDITTAAMTMRVTTAANGSYTAPNLAPNQVYTVRASRPGYVFQAQTVNLQPPGATVNIAAQNCTYTFSGTGSFGSTGGSGDLTVTAANQTCSWNAVRDVDWITIQSGSSVGNGSVQFSVLPNNGPARQGTIQVGEQSFTVTQASGCAFNLAGGVVSFPATGGSSSTIVSTTDAACTWNEAASDYCMIPGLSGPGTGNGTLSYTVAPNLGVARTATISIGGQTLQITQAAAAGVHRTRFDFNGDGKADISVFRPSTGVWYILTSPTEYSSTHFGLADDVRVAADYDGDGKTDLAVYRPSTGDWYWTRSMSPGDFGNAHFGQAGDIPAPGDYDGDGTADLAVYRPSIGVWFISNNTPTGYTATQFGIAEDKPVAADFDGDGKTDIAVYRPSTNVWYISNSSNGIFRAVQFGTGQDIPVQADYDGDGKADVAVYRPSDTYWYRLNSSTGAFVYNQFGSAGDLPAPADYNGDKLADIAVYRPSTTFWYIWSCTNNPAISATQFGISTDVPIAFPISN